MKVASLYAVWVVAAVAQGGVVLTTRRGQIFTLIRKQYTWNEAQDACDSIGQKMLIIRNQDEATIFAKIAETWKTEHFLTMDMWTGLYDRQPDDASDTQYYWQGDCSPLGNFNLWHDSEPNHQDQDFCVRLDKGDYLSRTATCDMNYNVVCQKEEDCRFETLNRRVISMTDFNVSSPDVANCQELCLTTDFGDTECVACEYTPTLSLCRMALSHSRYIGDEQPATSDSTSSSVHIKRCYKGYYNTDTLNIVDNSDTWPIDRCPTPTTTAAANGGGLPVSPSVDATPTPVTNSNMASTTGIPASTSTTAVSDATATAPTATTSTIITAFPTISSGNAISGDNPPAPTLSPSTTVTTITGFPAVTTSVNAVSAATASTPTSATPRSSTVSSTTTSADITATSTTTLFPTAATQFVSTSTTMEPIHPNNSTTTSTTPRLFNVWEICNISKEETHSVCICQRQVLEVFDRKEEHQLLILEKTSLSSYRRSKTSVGDERPSAISIGATGSTVIIIVVIAIASNDFFRCCVWLLQLKKAN